MSGEIDSGFFEPFRNNIISYSDGFFVINVPNPVIFNRDIVMEYFDEAIVNYNNDGVNPTICTFKCKPKTKEIEQILYNMFFNRTISINGTIDFKSPDTD